MSQRSVVVVHTVLLIICYAQLSSAQCTSALPTVLNGRFPTSCINAPNGTVCTAICNQRYTSIPTPTVTCLANGSWSRPTAICQQVCQGMPSAALTGGKWAASCNGTTKISSWCAGECDENWSGSPRVLCTSLGWANTQIQGKCVQGTVVCAGKPATVLNGNCCLDTAPGAACEAICNSGPQYWYNRTGNPRSFCQADGTWSIPVAPAYCEQQRAISSSEPSPTPSPTPSPPTVCPGSPANPTNGTFSCGTSSLPGTTCNATCAGGFTGSPSSTCQADGSWGAVAGSCTQIVCPGSPANPTNGTFSCGTSSLPGTTCNATCAGGFTVSPSSTCQGDGSWGAVAGSCTQTVCPGSPADPTNGIFSCGTSSLPGTTCNATCAGGFTVSPSSTCQADGSWGAVAGSCTQIVCPDSPANPTNGIFSCGASSLPGTTCNATCAGGFTGSPSSTCQADGSWGAVAGSCTQIECTGSPSNPTNGAFNCGNSTLSGNTCTNTCNPGFGAEGALPSLVCQLNGQWSNVTGSCIQTGCLISTFAFDPATTGNLTTFTEGMSATALKASSGSVESVSVDASDNVYIAVSGSLNRIFRIQAGTSTLELIAGNGTAAFAGDGGSAKSASLRTPRKVVFDKAGAMYILDSGNMRIRKVGTDGIISTFAGRGSVNPFGADGDLATTVGFLNRARDMVLSTAAGQLYYGDYSRCVIRRIDLATSQVYTVAGKSTATSTTCGNFVTGANATSSAIASPSGLALDPTQKKIYFSQDNGYARVDVLDLEAGTLGRLAGNNGLGYLGDGGLSTAAQVWSPAQLTTDSQGRVYIPDASGHHVRLVNATGIIKTIIGTGSSTASYPEGGWATSTGIPGAKSVAVDSKGIIYVADRTTVRKVTCPAQM